MKTLSPKKNGFTLVEAIIVLALVGILFTTLFASYLQIKKVLTEQSGRSMRSESAMIFMKVLSADLQNLVNEPWNPKQMFISKKNMVAGKRIDTLVFVSGSGYANPSTMQSQVRTVTYEVSHNFDADDKLSIVRIEDSFADYKNPGHGIPIPLFENPVEFSLEYSQTGQDWSDEWDYVQRQSFPRYIKSTLRWEEGDILRESITQIRPPIMWY